MTTYEDIEAYYRAHPAARCSGESDYGVWWRDADGGCWRVSYVHDTGHVYAVCLSMLPISRRIEVDGEAVRVASAGHGDGPVWVLAQVDPWPGRHRLGERRPTDALLAGWGEQCGRPRSLDWAINRARREARP